MGAKKETENGAELATAARTFKSVNGKSLEKDDSKAGGITFIRPKELAESGKTGVVAEGIYEGTVPNNFDESKNDYKIRTEAGDLIILNTTGSLTSQMSKVAEGSYVQVQYLGMNPITTGKMKGKLSHSFVVGVAD